MAHFAQIDETGRVLRVVVVDNEHAPDPAPEHSEPLGQAFIASIARHEPSFKGTWVQTSYSGRFRKAYASEGYRYDAEADVFIEPQPFSSWVLDVNFDWQAPTPMPQDGVEYYWDEGTLAWVPVPPE